MSADRFRGLARSSPWRWTALEFLLDWTVPAGFPDSREFNLHAWLARPDALRVEDAEGRELFAGRPGRSTTPPPELPGDPPRTPDGLVAAREWWIAAYDPLFQNYYWVALLDPAELADGTEVDDAVAVEHHGRPAWQATVRPVEGYNPRCSCCSLLPCEIADVYEGLAPRPDGFTYPDRFVARIDEQTGVCVYLEAIQGSYGGVQHDLTILVVT